HGVPTVDRDVLGLGTKRGTGVVDHDVEVAPLGDRALHHRLHLVLLADVDRGRKRPASEVGDLLARRLEVLELTAAESDVGTRACELDGDRLADAGAAAGDDGGLAVERERGLSHGRDDTPAPRRRLPGVSTAAAA